MSAWFSRKGWVYGERDMLVSFVVEIRWWIGGDAAALKFMMLGLADWMDDRAAGLGSALVNSQRR